MDYSIKFPAKIAGDIALPASKSITNRALILNALSGNGKMPHNCADCDDSNAMIAALRATDAERIDIGAAGTTMRFLTAYYAMQQRRETTLDGSERMRQRPIGVLVEALRQCGAEIEYAGNAGFPPLRIKGRRLSSPGILTLPGNVSSQYISAIMMISPMLDKRTEIHLTGEMTSIPYIDMTVSLMREYGAEIERQGDVIVVQPGEYSPIDYAVESDWSGASYWYEIAALLPGSDIALQGLKEPSVQGDSRIAEIFTHFGVATTGARRLEPAKPASKPLEIDMADCPDLAQTVVVTACMLDVHFDITGLRTLRIKETDRMEALRSQLYKLGYDITIVDDNRLAWHGERHAPALSPTIDTFKDHRMAMAFAPAAIKFPGLVIRDVDVVSKSYPSFWQHLAQCDVILTEK
ncbi:MAG: 3-phosphoshikimate 1-carboxyvinyltransferase [Muribaculaceae bacterium]